MDRTRLLDTSLALPTEPQPSSRNTPANPSLRVSQQVQLIQTQRQRQSSAEGGVNSVQFTANGGDAADGFLSRSKANESALYRSLSLTNHELKSSTRMAVPPKSWMELSSTNSPVHHNTRNTIARPGYSHGSGTQMKSNSQLRTLPRRNIYLESTPCRQVQSLATSPGTLNRVSLGAKTRPPFSSTRVHQNGLQLNHRQSQLCQSRGDSQKTLNQTSSPLSVNSTGVKRSMKAVLPHIQKETVTKRNLGNEPPKMTLEEAVRSLLYQNEEKLIAGAAHIQHECYRDDSAKSTIKRLGGVEKLVMLLDNESENVQCAAAGALRNVVQRHEENKLKVNEHNGIKAILSALKSSYSKETKRHLTGLLWNLSAHKELKEIFPKETATVLTKSVLVPTSGIFEGDNPKHELSADAEAFSSALNCLQNLSSAGDDTRKTLRECENLIDSLVYYIRKTVDDHNADDESIGISVHILHNLTYKFEPELPRKNTQGSSESQKNVAPEPTHVGCFPRRAAKITKDPEEESPVLKEPKPPHGSEYLWSSITIRLYLSLLARSRKDTTQLAAIGALHNATAGNGEMPKVVAATLNMEKDQLQVIGEFLQKGDEELMKAAISLIRNLSQHQVLQATIVKEMLPEINNLLAQRKEVASLCQILINLCWNSTETSRAVLEKDVLPKIQYISELGNSNCITEDTRKASLLLHIMWKHHELHEDFKAKGFKKSDFINEKTKQAVKAGKDK